MDRRGRLVPARDLELLDLEVTRAGSSVRYLEGGRYGLAISIFPTEALMGSGPVPHTHDCNEVFVLIDGRGRYFVGDDTIDATTGDVVIVPAGVRHAFVGVGPGVLRHIALHEAPAFASHRDDAGST
jgi:mannose-6-phosphate isomerase-like protein (cupin superfamily)